MILDKPLMLTSDDGNDSKELIIKNYTRRENRTVEWDCTGLEMGEI